MASYEWTMALRLVKIHFFESHFNSLLGIHEAWLLPTEKAIWAMNVEVCGGRIVMEALPIMTLSVAFIRLINCVFPLILKLYSSHQKVEQTIALNATPIYDLRQKCCL